MFLKGKVINKKFEKSEKCWSWRHLDNFYREGYILSLKLKPNTHLQRLWLESKCPLKLVVTAQDWDLRTLVRVTSAIVGHSCNQLSFSSCLQLQLIFSDVISFLGTSAPTNYYDLRILWWWWRWWCFFHC